MKTRIIWLTVSCLVVLSMVLTSCAPAAPEEEAAVTEKEAVTEKKEVVKEVVTEKEATPVVEKPEFGGTATIGLVRDNQGFDQIFLGDYWHINNTLVYEELLEGDWTLGPAGSGKTTFAVGQFAPDGFFRDTGRLAESWEIPDNQTLIFHIRKGVFWQNKPPVNGRQFTASDVVWNLRWIYLNPKYPRTYNVVAAPGGKKVTDVYLDPDDKWTVVVKVEDLADIFLIDIGDKLWHYAPEVYETYGDAKDWRNSLGTGPFMVTDYVPGSSVTFTRNPSYWMTNPIGPGKGDQLPYLDGVKALVIPDSSTQLAALRTGRIDQWGIGSALTSGSAPLLWEDVESLLATTPRLKTQEVPGANQGIVIRSTSTDPLAAPLMKKRVRQALMMAIDKEAILRDYYKGKGLLRAVLFYPDSPYFSSDDEMVEILQRVHGFKPEEAQMAKKVWGYYPDEAKKILAEEGYPNGFKTSVMLTALEVELVSIVQGYWEKIGVDLELDVKEQAVAATAALNRAFPAMKTGGSAMPGWSEKWMFYGPGDPSAPRSPNNYADLNDPVINDAINRSNAVFGDIPTRSKIIKETEPYLIQLAWHIQLPGVKRYIVWQPWLKNYHGEAGLGYHTYFTWLKFAWLDQELKAEITEKR